LTGINLNGTFLDEKATLDSFMSVVRNQICQGVVKEECDLPAEAGPQRIVSPWRPHQFNLIKILMREAWRYDPAQNPAAASFFQHLIRDVDVDVLRHTHDKVNPTFRHGGHRGVPVGALTSQLLSGRVTPHNIPALVVVQLDSRLWVVFGNRRLKALKDYRTALRQPVWMRCIVHNHDTGTVPSAVLAKFLLSSTTSNLGAAVEVR